MDPHRRLVAPSAPRRLFGASSLLALLLVATLAAPAAAADPLVAASSSTGSPIVSVRTRAPLEANLFASAGFRYQDPDYNACTAASALVMLNLIRIAGTGGPGFGWRTTTSLSAQTTIFKWERTYDTLPGGKGSDPHGWRNALNYYGWGSAAMWAGNRVYDDYAFATYESAMKSAVRALIRTRKPVGMLGWRGRHAQMITGYYGLNGDPFAKDGAGAYTNAFSVGGFWVSDPLRSDGIVNLRVGYETLRTTSNLKLRFQTYAETDSTYDDPYSSGSRPSWQEWYGKFVLVLPIR